MSQPKIRTSDVYTTSDPTVGGDTNKVLVDEFAHFQEGVASPGPTTFRTNSVTGFDAYNSTDFPGLYYTGITCVGTSNAGFQLAVSWNAEEDRPTEMFIRTNDDTSVTTAWSQWARVHVGDITFTTSTATPTGGVPGDFVYDTTTPTTWANVGGTWIALTQMFANDNGTWRAIQQMWRNSGGTWFKVFQA